MSLPIASAMAASSFPVPISIDTTKAAVARAALDAGAAIVNDISALRFDFHIADEVAKAGAGLVLMHSRGTPATMQRLPPVADVMEEVTSSLRSSIAMAERRGVKRESIVIDPGIGCRTECRADCEARSTRRRPTRVSDPDGTSRKSFIGHVLKDLLKDGNGNPLPATDRLHGTMASVTAAILKGVHIVRVHDVKAAVGDYSNCRCAQKSRIVTSEKPRYYCCRDK